MTDDRLLFELSDGIAILTLNRPAVMNAFEDGMREALFQRLEACADDPLRCVVITGAGRLLGGRRYRQHMQLQDQNDLSVVEARMAIAGQVIQQFVACRSRCSLRSTGCRWRRDEPGACLRHADCE